MSGLRAALIALGVLLAALALQVGVTWPQRVDVGAAERYGRGLRTVLALELSLSGEVLRAKSGLIGHFDALVDVEQRLRRQLAALGEPPIFLEPSARQELARAVATAELERARVEQQVERFKSEYAVLRNSLSYLPVAARALDAYAPSNAEEQRFQDGAAALVRDVLLLQTISDQALLDRAGERLRALDRPAAKLSGELALIVAHARIALVRTPLIAGLVRELTQRPALQRSEETVARYERFLARARLRAGRNAEVSFGLLLLSVLCGALAIILRLRELAELKGRFISMMSHEIRTPLSAIMSSSELLEAYAERWPAEKKQAHYDRIRSSVRAMLRLLDGVLMVGRSEAGKLEFKPTALPLRQFCEETVRNAAEICRGDHEIVLDGPSEHDMVIADEHLLRHVVDNLLSNAIKYSPRGSRVSLSARRHGDEVWLEVSDQGIGISTSDRQRLFETFERGSNVGAIPGHGLGLAIAKRAIDLHGGSLSVASGEGRGTRFTVRLPSAQATA